MIVSQQNNQIRNNLCNCEKMAQDLTEECMNNTFVKYDFSCLHTFMSNLFFHMFIFDTKTTPKARFWEVTLS